MEPYKLFEIDVSEIEEQNNVFRNHLSSLVQDFKSYIIMIKWGRGTPCIMKYNITCFYGSYRS